MSASWQKAIELREQAITLDVKADDAMTEHLKELIGFDFSRCIDECSYMYRNESGLEIIAILVGNDCKDAELIFNYTIFYGVGYLNAWRKHNISYDELKRDLKKYSLLRNFL